jgi:cytoskeletal protein CcmA (bactofilin family)
MFLWQSVEVFPHISKLRREESGMKKSISDFIVSITALLMILAGCDGLITSNVNVKDDGGSGHYYVDRVPANGIPVIDDLNNGNQQSADYVIAEAFNKYDAIYLVAEDYVTVVVPPGKTLYVAPGSNVTGFNVAAEVSKGNAARNAGLDVDAGPGTIVVLDGATMNLSGPSTLGGLLQVNVGGIISGPSAAITGTGKVIVGGKVVVSNITVAGEVYIAQGDGCRYGVVQADIDTTYLSLPTLMPDEDGRIDSSSRSDDDFYAFENAEPAASRNVTVDGVAIGDIISGGHIYVAENNRVTGLNKFYGYVAGSGSSGNATIITYGNAEVLGNVEGSVIAKGSVAVGSKLSSPHRAQVRSAIYSRTGNVVINTRANSGDIVAYQGSVTIEAGGGATGIDTYYNNYDNGDSNVARGDVIVRGIVNSSVGASSGSGDINSGGSIIVAPYRSESADFNFNGYVGGDVSSRRSATIDGVVLGSLYAQNSFDRTGPQDVIVNGYVGGRVTAGGTLAVADHHNVPENINSGAYIGSIYANGYVGGGAEIGQNGSGQSILKGLVEGGSLHIHSPANVVIATTGRVNVLDSQGATVSGALAIEALGELDADAIDEIYYNGSSPLNGVYVYAHASNLANNGRLGPPESGITIASGAKIYTQEPIPIPNGATLNYDSGTESGIAASAEHDERLKALADSNVIHTNVTPFLASLGVSTPLALTVGAYNSVTLVQDTELAGTINVNGLLALNGHELAASGAIALASDASNILNYDIGDNYVNGYISFGYAFDYGSLKFTGAAAALCGLSSLSEQRTDYDYSAGQPYNAGPVVFGVTRPYSDPEYSTTVADFESPYPAILQDAPGETFAPGAGAVLKGSGYHGGHDYISKDSRFIWGFTTYTP